MELEIIIRMISAIAAMFPMICIISCAIEERLNGEMSFFGVLLRMLSILTIIAIPMILFALLNVFV